MPKSIVKEQKLIFLYIYYSMIFEGISDFIHATDFFLVFLTVNGPCDVICGFLPIEIKRVEAMNE